MAGEGDLGRLLATLQPVARDGAFVFVTSTAPIEVPALCTLHEAEGVTYVLRRDDADAHGLPYDLVAAWITLDVHSALDAVGLTAAVSSALATAGISCNVLAGYFHDHLLVPHDRAEEALAVLEGLRTGQADAMS